MSVLIEGYQDNTGLTSLKGTLVPAKTLNKISTGKKGDKFGVNEKTFIELVNYLKKSK